MAAWPVFGEGSGNPNMFVEFADQCNDEVLLSTALHAVNAIPFVRARQILEPERC